MITPAYHHSVDFLPDNVSLYIRMLSLAVMYTKDTKLDSRCRRNRRRVVNRDRVELEASTEEASTSDRSTGECQSTPQRRRRHNALTALSTDSERRAPALSAGRDTPTPPRSRRWTATLAESRGRDVSDVVVRDDDVKYRARDCRAL